jgi:hypothetical protein
MAPEESSDRKVEVGITQPSGRTVLSASFTSQEWDTLNRYSDYVRQLRSTKAFSKQISVRLQFHWQVGQNLSVEVGMPDWEDVIVLLHRMRPFLLHDEDTNFGKVKNVLSRRFEDPRIRGMIAYNGDLYSGKHASSILRIEMSRPTDTNSIVLNSESFFETWLNGHEFHRDHEKQKFVDQVNSIFPEEATKALHISLLIDKMKAVNNLCGLIDVVLGRIKEFVT